MSARFFNKAISGGIFTLLLAVSTVCSAQDEDLESLELFAGATDGVVTTARSPRPTSQIAENVTVINAAQIAALNAHTLADVLQTVPGIQLEQVQTPGSFSFFWLEGSINWHVQVLMDGVPLNNLDQSQISPALIPVQQIERIEIIKGAASAAWGQALGGVVNVVTKAPSAEKALSGVVSASYGTAATRDLRAELTGTTGRFGYYLSGGNLSSNGLIPKNGTDFNNLYGKFSYDLIGKGNLTAGASVTNSYAQQDEVYGDTARESDHYAFLRFSYPLSQHLDLEVAARESRKRNTTIWGDYGTGQWSVFQNTLLREFSYAGSTNLAWTGGEHKIVAGAEYEHDEIRQTDELNLDSADLVHRTADKTAVYANGAFSFGRFTLLPGARFDHTGLSGDAFSYTVGATFLVTDKTVLRGYGAKGYSLPNVKYMHGLEKVRTLQAGVESSDIPNLWVKMTVFYNELSNIGGTSGSTFGTFQKQIREGWELEARTVPFYSFSLSAGYTFTDAYELGSGMKIPEVPVRLAKLGLHYENRQCGLTGVLTGSYVVRYLQDVDANGLPYQFLNPNDHGMLWDFSLTKRVASWENSPELFFSAHNLFNATQYRTSLFPNVGRWIEGGVRFKF